MSAVLKSSCSSSALSFLFDKENVDRLIRIEKTRIEKLLELVATIDSKNSDIAGVDLLGMNEYFGNYNWYIDAVCHLFSLKNSTYALRKFIKVFNVSSLKESDNEQILFSFLKKSFIYVLKPVLLNSLAIFSLPNITCVVGIINEDVTIPLSSEIKSEKKEGQYYVEIYR